MGSTYIGDIPNPHVRDFQRKKLYEAEMITSFWSSFKILSRPEVKQLVKKISDWSGIESPTVAYETSIKNGRIAFATMSSLVLPFPLARSTPYICHEMSHVINYQKGPTDHHGPNYAGVYLNVIEEFIGTEAKQELQQSFNDSKVKYNLVC